MYLFADSVIRLALLGGQLCLSCLFFTVFHMYDLTPARGHLCVYGGDFRAAARAVWSIAMLYGSKTGMRMTQK